MIIIRSFDINKPGTNFNKLEGGVLGGSILKGILKVGDEIEIRPGIFERNPTTDQIIVKPLKTNIISLLAEKNELVYALPGGLIGLGTNLDPYLS